MSKIERFEDLIAWQKARSLTYAIYEVTRRDSWRKDSSLGTNSAGSGINNVKHCRGF